MQMAGSTALNLVNYSHYSVEIYFENLHEISCPFGKSDIGIDNSNLNSNPKKPTFLSKQRGIEINIIEN